MGFKIDLSKKREYAYPTSIKEVDELTGEEFERFIFHYFNYCKLYMINLEGWI